MLSLHGSPQHAADPMMVVCSLGVLASRLLFVINLFLNAKRGMN